MYYSAFLSLNRDPIHFYSVNSPSAESEHHYLFTLFTETKEILFLTEIIFFFIFCCLVVDYSFYSEKILMRFS